MARFVSLQGDVTGEDEVLLTFETKGGTFSFEASADDVVGILEALEETIEEVDEGVEANGHSNAANYDHARERSDRAAQGVSPGHNEGFGGAEPNQESPNETAEPEELGRESGASAVYRDRD